MTTLTLSEAKAGLSAVIDDVERLQERAVITRHGRPAAILVSPEELAAMDETLYWMSVRDTAESLERSEADVAAGRTFTQAEVEKWVAAGMPNQLPSGQATASEVANA